MNGRAAARAVADLSCKEPPLHGNRSVAQYFERRGFLGGLHVPDGPQLLSTEEFRTVHEALGKKTIPWSESDPSRGKRLKANRKRRERDQQRRERERPEATTTPEEQAATVQRLRALLSSAEMRELFPAPATPVEGGRWGSYTSFGELFTMHGVPGTPLPTKADLAKQKRGGPKHDPTLDRSLLAARRAVGYLVPSDPTPSKTVALLAWWYCLTKRVSPAVAKKEYATPVAFLNALVRAVEKRISRAEKAES